MSAGLLALAALLVPPGGLADWDLREEQAADSRLPGRLREISGLATTADGRLLAHHDEAGIVFELDAATGEVVKQFELADLASPIRDDFEGIAAGSGRVWMVTSAGRLYEFEEGGDGESVLFAMFATGIGRSCEVEGLAYDPDRERLLIACKRPLRGEPEDRLAIHAWSIHDQRLDEKARLDLDARDFSGDGPFRPSGIEIHPATGNYYLVAARRRSVAEVTPEGRVLSVRRFPARWHRQLEGITFGPDGSLIVSDEGAGRRARLTVYPPVAR